MAKIPMIGSDRREQSLIVTITSFNDEFSRLSKELAELEGDIRGACGRILEIAAKGYISWTFALGLVGSMDEHYLYSSPFLIRYIINYDGEREEVSFGGGWGDKVSVVDRLREIHDSRSLHLEGAGTKMLTEDVAKQLVLRWQESGYAGSFYIG